MPLESKKKIENKPQLEYLFLDLNRYHERLHSILFRFSGQFFFCDIFRMKIKTIVYK